MQTATIQTAKGDIQLELFDEDAPNTVANFVKLIGQGFYDGLTFHRHVPNFVIQGGCPNTREGAKGVPGTGGPGYKIRCETANNPQKHAGPGILSMAHAGPNTGGSQFFITLRATPHLDGLHTVFGRVTSGMDVVNAIRAGDRIVKVTAVAE
jgi:peptidyl-prolyl cis-trans isomerase B (cyclophilin B)